MPFPSAAWARPGMPAPHLVARAARWAGTAALAWAATGTTPWALALANPQPAAAQPRFNDSGQVRCVNPQTASDIPCDGTGQDGASGRDLSAPSSKDGQAGFSFVKIAADGRALPRNATTWDCVQDQVTGLMWEVKTRDRGLRDRNKTYTQRGDGSAREASVFASAVNASGLCGHQDWRLPSHAELLSLVDFSRLSPAPTIDAKWFPNSVAADHWTDTPSLDFGAGARAHWVVGFARGDTGTGRSDLEPPAALRVRLVRGVPLPPTAGRFLLQAGEARDPLTGLVWRRCAEGTTWDGSQCVGTPLRLSWGDALAHAGAAAAADGLPWRLPNAKELASLTHEQAPTPPRVDTLAFPGTSYAHPFWSATHAGPFGQEARAIGFDVGNLGVQLHEATHHVRLVRSAP